MSRNSTRMSLDSPRAHYYRSRRAGTSIDPRIFVAGVAEVNISSVSFSAVSDFTSPCSRCLKLFLVPYHHVGAL